MMQDDSKYVPVFKLSEVLIRRRLQKDPYCKSDLKHLQRQWRLNSLELLFGFQRGPHKFNSIVYPKPCRALLNTLLNRICQALCDCDRASHAAYLSGITSKLNLDHDETRNALIFLLLLSDLKTEIPPLGTIRIPDKPPSCKSSLLFPSPHTELHLSYTESLNTVHLSKENQRLDKLLNSQAFTIRNNNHFRKALNMDIRSSDCVPYFCGAFVQESSTFACGRALACDSSVDLDIPPLPCGLGDGNFDVFERARNSYPSGDKEDEGYAGSCTDGYIALDEHSARQTISSLLINATPAVADLIIDLLFPCNRDTRTAPASSAQSCLLATKDLNDLLTTIANQRVQRFCWTKRGIPQPAHEAPMLSELGPISLPVCLDIRRARFRLNCAHGDPIPQAELTRSDQISSNMPKDAQLSRQSFIHDFLLMHLGIPSERFRWLAPEPEGDRQQTRRAPLEGKFVYTPNRNDQICLGCSELSLNTLLEHHLKAGTHYRRLVWLCRHLDGVSDQNLPYSTNSLCQGPTWTALLDAISTCLTAYEEAVQLLLERERISAAFTESQSTDKQITGLLRMTYQLKSLTDRLEYLIELCSLNSPDYYLLDKRGLVLLAHLARCSMHTVSTPDESLTRFIFKRSCQPFLNFLESLLLDGSYHNGADEFNLHVSHKHLFARGSTFWTDAFRFDRSDPEDPSGFGLMNWVPRSFQLDVLRCAKSIQLLKLVKPKHFILKNRSFFPKLEFPVNGEAIRLQQTALQNYLNKVKASALESRSTRIQHVARIMARRQELLRRAAEVHARHLAAVESRTQQLLADRRAKQDHEFEELKQAAQEAVERRRAALEAEKAADRALLEAVTRAESYEKEVIAQARAELESHYANLIEEVDARRRAAEGRIETSRLLNSTVEESGAKVREFKANRSDPAYSVETGPHEPVTNNAESSNSVDNATLSFDELNTISVPALVGSEKQSSVGKETPIAMDPLSVLRAKFRQRNAGCIPGAEQMFQLLYPDSTATSSQQAQPLLSGQPEPKPASLKSDGDSVNSSVARFRARNQFGHSSDSTVQQMLYGTGTGPACRASVWAQANAAQDAVDEAIELAQPDAHTFYREALLPTVSHTSSLPKFTKQFPDFTELSHVNPFSCTTKPRGQQPELPPNSTGQLNRMPLQVMLDRVVLSPLLSYIHEVDQAICNHFLYDLRLLDHFHCLRQICFLEQGEFAQSLLDGLFEKADGPLSGRSAVYSPVFLRDLMQRVLRKFTREPTTVDGLDADIKEGQETYDPEWEDCHTCFPIHCPIDLVPILDERTNETQVDPRRAPAFEHLAVMYAAPWPVNIVLHPSALAKYNRAFRQLVRVKFAVWALNACYHHLRALRPFQPQQQPATSTTCQFHLTSVWLHEMYQVVRGLETYLTNQAVKASWSKFVHQLTVSGDSGTRTTAGHANIAHNVKSLDDLCSVHEAYLDEVMRGCLLDVPNQEIQQVICGLLSCVHWFYKVLSTGSLLSRTDPTSGQLNRTGWRQLEAAHASFVQHARFLRRRAGRLLSTSSRIDRNTSCLGQLVLAFGINEFYSGPTIPLAPPLTCRVRAAQPSPSNR